MQESIILEVLSQSQQSVVKVTELGIDFPMTNNSYERLFCDSGKDFQIKEEAPDNVIPLLPFTPSNMSSCAALDKTDSIRKIPGLSVAANNFRISRFNFE